MAPDDQREVIAFLSTPRAYDTETAVERIDTHISIVWLAGHRVYKLKRAVRYDYVDFSTPELRRVACEAEVRLNRRTAPSLYVGVRAVTRDAAGGLTLGGDGAPVDWLVEMVRFDQETLFDRLAERNRLDPALMEGLADAIVRLHATAEARPEHGGRDGMAWVIDGNASSFAGSGAILSPDACTRLSADARATLSRCADRLDDRRRRGLVRQCHGDLHLRNICLVEGAPTLFDAVEFNDRISCVDVVYDFSFLLMDLWRRRLAAAANRVFNEYFIRTVDLDAFVALPLFLSCRAAVRAKTSATAATLQPGEAERRASEASAREYLALAQELLSPPQPCLIAVGGFSGAGKSTLAEALAPSIGAVPGALLLRSDVIRKTLFGVSSSTRLDAAAYAPDVTSRVYETMLERARVALGAGHAVIADAVHAAPEDRLRIERVARGLRVPFAGLWLEGPRELLNTRLGARTGDASDATPEILDRQIEAGAGALTWHRLDGSPAPDRVLDLARAFLSDLEIASSIR
jgi:aminoglycoside phosphotransferase family enzyme/predicted kinase